MILLFQACGSGRDGSINDALVGEISGEEGAANYESGCGSMEPLACELFIMVNDYREANLLSPLKVLKKCVLASQSHSQDMVDRGFFAHNSPTETFSERMVRFGIVNGAVAENIVNAGSTIQALDLWEDSPGHNNNMLNPNYNSGGMGYVDGHWTHCFSSL